MAMGCDQRLALLAILTALRQSGAIDRRAVGSISAMLKDFAARSGYHCSDTAESLLTLAELIDKGPLRSCLPSSPGEFFAALVAADKPAVAETPLH